VLISSVFRGLEENVRGKMSGDVALKHRLLLLLLLLLLRGAAATARRVLCGRADERWWRPWKQGGMRWSAL